MIVSLNLKGVPSIVIGERPEALTRAVRLAEEGSFVDLYFGAQSPALHHVHPNITLKPGLRPHRRALRRAQIVIATDRDPATNLRLARALKGRPNLLNTVDEKSTCNFYHVATRQPHQFVTIAVSTQGQSPRFAGLLAERLVGLITEEDLALFETLRRRRQALHALGQSTILADWGPVESEFSSAQVSSVAGSESDQGCFHNDQALYLNMNAKNKNTDRIPT
jgi:siroheme synthase (precorrin-2 oxidase/ferrochelatase)